MLGRDECSFLDCETSRWKPSEKIASKATSGIGAIIKVKRFRCLERMLRVTPYVLRLCTKLFERLKEKIYKLVDVDDVMKEKCLVLDELLDADKNILLDRRHDDSIKKMTKKKTDFIKPSVNKKNECNRLLLILKLTIRRQISYIFQKFYLQLLRFVTFLDIIRKN